MASKNLAGAKKLVEAYNKHDIEGIVSVYSEQSVLIDHARGETLKGRTGMRQNAEMWLTAFPDAQLDEPRYTDGGDKIVVQFTGRGTNTGPMGPFPAAGKKASVPYCIVVEFDSSGKIVEEDDYYDLLGLLVQLGHAKPPM